MAIDNHLEFKEDEAGTERMFACERRSRARYNECMACSTPMQKGSYFDDEKNEKQTYRQNFKILFVIKRNLL